jgi:hypothetical protein
MKTTKTSAPVYATAHDPQPTSAALVTAFDDDMRAQMQLREAQRHADDAAQGLIMTVADAMLRGQLPHTALRVNRSLLASIVRAHR